jgi:hypothetical protein
MQQRDRKLLRALNVDNVCPRHSLRLDRIVRGATFLQRRDTAEAVR